MQRKTDEKLAEWAIWTLAGPGWGWQIYNNFSKQWGVGLIATAIILGVTIFLITVNRMQNNDERKIRETLAAFLIGFETGLLKRDKLSSQNR